MKILISYDIKFKTNVEKLSNLLLSYGFKQIQKTIYFGEINIDKINKLKINITEITQEKDSVLFIPICKTCFDKKEVYGKYIEFQEELYKIL